MVITHILATNTSVKRQITLETENQATAKVCLAYLHLIYVMYAMCHSQFVKNRESISLEKLLMQTSTPPNNTMAPIYPLQTLFVGAQNSEVKITVPQSI